MSVYIGIVIACVLKMGCHSAVVDGGFQSFDECTKLMYVNTYDLATKFRLARKDLYKLEWKCIMTPRDAAYERSDQ